MKRIEDYALLGDLQTAALIDREGSIDWCCFPRFDSGACFAALLGGPENGRWQIAPTGAIRRNVQRARGARPAPRSRGTSPATSRARAAPLPMERGAYLRGRPEVDVAGEG